MIRTKKNHTKKKHTITKMPSAPSKLKALASVMFHSTIESCWCASDRAQRRR